MRRDRIRYGLGVLTVCVAVTGCQAVVEGAAQPADHLGPLTSTPSAAVKRPSLADILLGTAEVAGMVGATSMTRAATFTDPSNDVSAVTPGRCLHRMYPAQRFLYIGADQMAGNILRDSGERRVAQVVSMFKTSNDTNGTVLSAAAVWKGCLEPFTVTVDGNVAHWTPDAVSRAENRASTATQKQGTQLVCQHLFAAKGSYLVETEVCGEDGQSGRQAEEITDRILAKIPE